MIECREGHVRLTVYVQPGAAKTEWVGLHGDAIKVRLQAPPVEGRANACLIEFIARWTEVPKSAVRILSGDTARRKKIAVEDPHGSVCIKLRQLLGGD